MGSAILSWVAWKAVHHCTHVLMTQRMFTTLHAEHLLCLWNESLQCFDVTLRHAWLKPVDSDVLSDPEHRPTTIGSTGMLSEPAIEAHVQSPQRLGLEVEPRIVVVRFRDVEKEHPPFRTPLLTPSYPRPQIWRRGADKAALPLKLAHHATD